MLSAIETNSQNLLQRLKKLQQYEAIVFVENDGVFQALRLYDIDLKVAIKADYHVDAPVVSGKDVPSRLSSALHVFSRNERLLIDTLTVKIKSAGAPFEYASPTDEIFQLTSNLLQEAFRERTFQLPVAEESALIIARLQEQLKAMDKFSSNVWASFRGFDLAIELITAQNAEYVHLYRRHSADSFEGVHCRVPDLRCAFQVIQHFVHGTELTADTLIIRTNRLSKGITAEEPVAVDDDLYRLARQYFVAASDGVLQSEVPAGFDPEAIRKTREKNRHDNLAKLLVSCLAQGPAGVALWSSRPEKAKGNYKKLVLSSSNLENINLNGLNFSSAKFNECRMKGAWMVGADVRSASFRGADLSNGTLAACKAQKADFTDCILQEVSMVGANLQNAVFVNADVSKADFDRADLRGVDLSACKNLSSAQFNGAIYDESSVFPEEFAQRRAMKWKGKSDDPYKKSAKLSAAAAAPSDFASFFQYIQKHFDKQRVDKALSMLKKETFQLFSEQTETGVTGVIKSQTDPDTVYACRLSFDGHFCCGTQNLNACGGLRGALCKHILVLLIGLVKHDELEAARAGEAVICSKLELPKLDRDAMSDVFLRYKAAAAGELDWRPTETIPEDYYGI